MLEYGTCLWTDHLKKTKNINVLKIDNNVDDDDNDDNEFPALRQLQLAFILSREEMNGVVSRCPPL